MIRAIAYFYTKILIAGDEISGFASQFAIPKWPILIIATEI